MFLSAYIKMNTTHCDTILLLLSHIVAHRYIINTGCCSGHWAVSERYLGPKQQTSMCTAPRKKDDRCWHNLIDILGMPWNYGQKTLLVPQPFLYTLPNSLKCRAACLLSLYPLPVDGEPTFWRKLRASLGHGSVLWAGQVTVAAELEDEREVIKAQSHLKYPAIEDGA